MLLESEFQQQKNDVRVGMRAKVLSAPFCAMAYHYNLVIDRICRSAQELVWLIRFFSLIFLYRTVKCQIFLSVLSPLVLNPFKDLFEPDDLSPRQVCTCRYMAKDRVQG